jgi:hypothetical protein
VSATNIRALKDLHRGQTIFVVASGATLNYLDQRLFKDSVVVTVNETWMHVPASYALMHHPERAQEAIDAHQTLVISERGWGCEDWGLPVDLRGNYYTYKTEDNNMSCAINVAQLEEDTTEGLVVSPCTTSEALQFAAHLGAAVILCCGIDGGALDGQWCVEGYNSGWPTPPHHIRLTQHILRATYAALRRRGTAVHSVSPFVGYDHEGHRYTAP